ncbi:Bone morphogenetic protein 1 [Mactra antiquata]
MEIKIFHCKSYDLLLCLSILTITVNCNYGNEMLVTDPYLQSVLGTKIIVKPGRHVCTTEKVISTPVRVSKEYKKPVYTERLRDCLNQTSCQQYDLNYAITNRTVFILQKSSSFRHTCCPGWTRGARREKGCMTPICSNGCGDFGVCVKPEKCECITGFTGELCDRDIDECGLPGHGCQQMCKNTAGSYMCACRKGFNLEMDGKTCTYCFKCQQEYTDLMFSMSVLQKQFSETVKKQTEVRQSLPDDNVMNKINKLEQLVQALSEENIQLKSSVSEIQEKYANVVQELETINETLHTKPPSTTTSSTPPSTATTTPSTSTTTTPSTTTKAPTTTTTAPPIMSTTTMNGLDFGLEDLIFSLSNQIGMMEEKLELCNCVSRRP